MEYKTSLERIRRDLESLAQFNATPGEGLTRLSYTAEHAQAAEYIRSAMEAAGLSVRTDAAGNIIGRLEGSEPELPSVMIGSHFDSVRHGGSFDGQIGVVAALETARVMRDEGFVPRRSVEFAAIIDEEGARFGGGLTGSRAMTGSVTRERLEQSVDDDGVSMYEAMRRFGLDPDRIGEAARRPGEIECFLELHIEQGPVLESRGVRAGIVTGIVGLKSLEVTVNGRPDHAGTTPMDMRADAMLAAAKLIIRLNERAVAMGRGTVATVGKLTLLPGSGNIVPGQVRFGVDIRSGEMECVDGLERALREDVAALGDECPGVSGDVRLTLSMDPVKLDGGLREVLTAKADELGLTHMDIPSGAGHDSMVLAGITRVGMLFVPSRGGRSHCPEEWTDYEQVRDGVEVIASAAEELAK